MRHLASLMAVLLLSVGCAAGVGPSASISASPPAIPSAAESSSPVRPSPSAIPTQPLTASPASTTTAACPTGSPLSVAVYVEAVEADPACFDGREVGLLGWADAPPGIELSPPGIAPSWLWFPRDYAALWDQPGCEDLEDSCPYLFVHINPESGLQWDTDGRWVLVTGHTDDPLAETCHYVYPSDWTGERLSESAAQDTCRSSFVLASVAGDSAP